MDGDLVLVIFPGGSVLPKFVQFEQCPKLEKIVHILERDV
jgi:hypothetical protein